MFGSGEIVIIQQKKIIVPSPVHYDSLKSFFSGLSFHADTQFCTSTLRLIIFQPENGPMIIFDP